MKKTLYQILGVDAKASTQAIEAAYASRHEELKVATIQDPNKLVVLQQSKEILSDPNQRAAYDVSLSSRDAPVSPPAHEEPGPSTFRRWGKSIAAAVVVIGVGVWWARHGSAPAPQSVPTRPIASRQAELPPRPAADPAASVATNPVALPAANTPPVADLPSNPLLGEWSCSDAISGRNSSYRFQQDGTLRIASTDGQRTDLKYELSGKTLTLTDPKQVSTLAIEELVARKMILYAGSGGQRVVCRQ